MKKFKILFTFFLFVFLSSTAVTAQSAKAMAKAKTKAAEKISELNEMLLAQDETLALTNEQKGKIEEAYIEKFLEVKKLKKSEEGTEEEREAATKAANQKYGKTVNSFLSKEQKKAKKAAKNKE